MRPCWNSDWQRITLPNCLKALILVRLQALLVVLNTLTLIYKVSVTNLVLVFFCLLRELIVMYVTATLLCILLCVLLTVLVAFGSFCFIKFIHSFKMLLVLVLLLLLLSATNPVSRESFPWEQDHLLLIGDQDRQRWVDFSEDLKSFACCSRTLL